MGEAQAEMTGAWRSICNRCTRRARRGSMPGTIHLWPGSPFGQQVDPGMKFSILLIMVTTMMVLVIACANVASLQLASSAAARQNELTACVCRWEPRVHG